MDIRTLALPRILVNHMISLNIDCIAMYMGADLLYFNNRCPSAMRHVCYCSEMEIIMEIIYVFNQFVSTFTFGS